MNCCSTDHHILSLNSQSLTPKKVFHNILYLPFTTPGAAHLFGLLQFILQGLLSHLHLDQLLPQLLILLLCPQPLLLHALQLMVQAHGHVFGHLGDGPKEEEVKKRRLIYTSDDVIE